MIQPDPWSPLSKRQSSEDDTQYRQIKAPRTARRPPEFWDNLSKIPLTKDALQEFNRRNRSVTSHVRRPVTRQYYKNTRASPSSAVEFLQRCSPRQLQDIKKTSRYGGPDLRDLRSYPPPQSRDNIAMPPNEPTSRSKKRAAAGTRSESSNSKRTSTRSSGRSSGGTYNRAFQQHLIDHGVYPDQYWFSDGRTPDKPSNWDDIVQRLSTPRDDLLPHNFTEEAFMRFKKENGELDADIENAALRLIPAIEGDSLDRRGGHYPLGNLNPLTDGTLPNAWPDRLYGSHPEQLHPQIREELSGYIVPSATASRPLMPTLFLEVKGPDQSALVAKRQACYYGALGARGVQALQSYKVDEPVYDGNAYTITATYHDGTLKLYTTHPVKPEGPTDSPKYYMHQINGFLMTGNIDAFREGATWYRNARAWTKEKRDEFVETANTRLSNSATDTRAVDVQEEEEADSDASSESNEPDEVPRVATTNSRDATPVPIPN
ncbi:hypothetical protein MferCBS31731_003884 [Microsporum ferrugineum]